MNSRIFVLAGTAMGLVLAASQSSATPLGDARIVQSLERDALWRVEPARPPLLLAQAETDEEPDEEELRRRLEEEAEGEDELIDDDPPVEEEDDILEEPDLQDEDDIEEEAPAEEEDILQDAPDSEEFLDEDDDEVIEDDEPLEEEIIETTEEPVEAEPLEADEDDDLPEDVPAEEEEDVSDDVMEPDDATPEEPVDEPVEDDMDGAEVPAEIDDEDLDEEVMEEADPPVDEEEPAEEAVDPDEREDAAPLLDSEKEAEQLGLTADDLPAAEEDVPPPESDADAQAEAQPVEIEPMRAEEGRRIERPVQERAERREGAEVLREIGDRVVIQFNNQLIVQGREDPRMGRDATEVYYEELPRGRTRETVVRPNGVMVVTIRDRYGDVIRRSRVMPDGTEYVLVYSDDRDRDREGRRQWRDPARELPPLRLRIPVEEYILEARRIDEWDDWEPYYSFLDRPPVERVQRLYTIDEVRYSSRVRDMMPRIELDTLTFDFGSAAIGEGEVRRLQGMAEAMHRMLDDNPAEMFMIEGHTDAVGTHEANLALSDRRAEAVAMALTDFFDIPPENMVTQGYGKNYLKINTQEPERLNRRVVVRRITPLVTPVAAR